MESDAEGPEDQAAPGDAAEHQAGPDQQGDAAANGGPQAAETENHGRVPEHKGTTTGMQAA
eukprot:8173014-Lingulodinium_polyedra.AAC.1